jgi:hypothetical protein
MESFDRLTNLAYGQAAVGPEPRPKPGEATPDQAADNHRRRGSGEVAAMLSMIPGYADALPGSFDTYRRMRRNPTVSIATAAATAPIKAAEIAFEGPEATDDQLELVQDAIEPMWPLLVREALWALHYGFKPFEKVYELEDGYYVLKKLKPLRVDDATVKVEKGTGRFAGLKLENKDNGILELPPEKVWWYTYDGEDGDYYGRPRHENIRAVWGAWNDLLYKEGQYATKTAGIIPIIRYPEGQSPDRFGRVRNHFELAEQVLGNLGRGNGVTMPNTLSAYAADLMQAGGASAKDILAWQISFLEQAGDHFGGIIASMQHKEAQMMRGWLVPERAATEGKFGTKAEAETHADLAISVAEEVLKDILRCVNWYVIDPMLALNWGPKARGAVHITAAPLVDEQKAFLRDIMSKVLAQPTNIDLLLESFDWDAALDQLGVPKKADTVVLTPDVAVDPFSAKGTGKAPPGARPGAPPESAPAVA